MPNTAKVIYALNEKILKQNELSINMIYLPKTGVVCQTAVSETLRDTWYTAILDCTITVKNRSSYLSKSANLETDLQFKG